MIRLLLVSPRDLLGRLAGDRRLGYQPLRRFPLRLGAPVPEIVISWREEEAEGEPDSECGGFPMKRISLFASNFFRNSAILRISDRRDLASFTLPGNP